MILVLLVLLEAAVLSPQNIDLQRYGLSPGGIVGFTVAIGLDFLNGRHKFPSVDIFSLMRYDE